MSIRLLVAVTHILVTIPNKDDALATGVRATVDLCFGPGDDSAISQVQLVKRDDDLAWEVPHVPYRRGNSHKCMVPVFRGRLLEEVCEMAARAVEHIKRDLGIPQYGMRYRVFVADNQVKVVVEESLAA